jgi:hypothetical protein
MPVRKSEIRKFLQNNAQLCLKTVLKVWVRKSQIRKVSHLRKVRKSVTLFKSANLRICDLRNQVADRPLLFLGMNKMIFFLLNCFKS